ncbi:hypothetical protein N0B51_10445 [Tsuneonella sp. YG55]|uniref:Uncharacterized protein n=1 Tax=Tsuneonella litorea TaxID=2976475 RepID=A0A9X3AN87_9SPHN|nr:hypothetical protein [Tsuneonella litorea]MCT2559397.1 hypothetical protein [Tsuneonella litorea]
MTAGGTTAGGALTVGAVAPVASATFTGNLTAASVRIKSKGQISLKDATATTALIDLGSGSLITTGTLLAKTNAILTASESVTAASITASLGSVDVDAGDAISAGAITAGTDAFITAGRSITTASKVSAGGTIDIDSTSGGSVTLGQALTGAGAALQAGTSITIDTTGAVIAGGTTATSGVLAVGTVAMPASVTFTGPVSSKGLTANTTGTFTTRAAVDAGSSASVSARDVEINAGFKATDLTLKAGATGGVALGSGVATFSLSDAELDRITATTLTVDAGANSVTISDVSLTTAAGSNRVDVATTGAVNFVGDLTADGAGRTIRIGGRVGAGSAASTGVAGTITGDIEAVTINVGQAKLDLRGNDIAFGTTPFLNEVAGRTSQDLARQVVGNATSKLYNAALPDPLGGDRANDPVYLRAGTLAVAYGNSALFQNTGTLGTGATTTNGVVIGSTGGGGALVIDTLDATNAFALFGQINNLVGPAAAIAPGSVVVIDDTLQSPYSRINGCLIRSGADCVNTIIGTTIISLPRENTRLLSSDTGLLVPFDPLVGTNNEGLFSDAASDDQNLDCPRDEKGVCVDR